jgi:hypothetical protein
LSDWEETIASGNISFSAGDQSLHISANGAGGQARGRIGKIFKGSIAMLATLQIAAVQGDALIGIRKHVAASAVTGGAAHTILAEIFFRKQAGNYSIGFRVNEKNPQNHTLEPFGGGHLGDASAAWAVGEEIIIAFAFIDGEIWFGTTKAGAFTKSQIFSRAITPTDDAFEVFVEVPQGPNSIDANVVEMILF